jgi:hypothetical protein
MDEAFVPLHQLILGMAAGGDLRTEDGLIHMYIHRFTVETPIELDLTARDDGTVAIGSVPPLYRENTTFRPSFHQIRFTAELSDG